MKNIFVKSLRVGIVGTGVISRGLAKLIFQRNDMVISKILTRRKGIIEGLGVSQDFITREPEKVFESSDLIVVSTGDPIYSTLIIDKAFEYKLPVVTMDADTQVVTGSWLSKRGEAVKITACQNHVPIGLLSNVEIKRNINAGELITFDDINIPDSLALNVWKDTVKGVQEVKIEKESVKK